MYSYLLLRIGGSQIEAEFGTMRRTRQDDPSAGYARADLIVEMVVEVPPPGVLHRSAV